MRLVPWEESRRPAKLAAAQLNGYLPAPPHDVTGHTWHHPDGLLFDLTKAATGNPDTAHLNVSVPKLSGAALEGEKVFSKNCSVCHGKNAAGSDKGPPLVHKIYEPNHHADGSIYIAVKRGVRKHHWPFGNMPPVPGVTDQQIATIVSYIRTLQRENGIF